MKNRHSRGLVHHLLATDSLNRMPRHTIKAIKDTTLKKNHIEYLGSYDFDQTWHNRSSKADLQNDVKKWCEALKFFELSLPEVTPHGPIKENWKRAVIKWLIP